MSEGVRPGARTRHSPSSESILFGSGITLGSLLSETGLVETIGNGIANTLGFTSLLLRH